MFVCESTSLCFVIVIAYLLNNILCGIFASTTWNGVLLYWIFIFVIIFSQWNVKFLGIICSFPTKRWYNKAMRHNSRRVIYKFVAEFSEASFLYSYLLATRVSCMCVDNDICLYISHPLNHSLSLFYTKGSISNWIILKYKFYVQKLSDIAEWSQVQVVYASSKYELLNKIIEYFHYSTWLIQVNDQQSLNISILSWDSMTNRWNQLIINIRPNLSQQNVWDRIQNTLLDGTHAPQLPLGSDSLHDPFYGIGRLMDWCWLFSKNHLMTNIILLKKQTKRNISSQSVCFCHIIIITLFHYPHISSSLPFYSSFRISDIRMPMFATRCCGIDYLVNSKAYTHTYTHNANLYI